MQVLKLVDVASLQAGDIVVINNSRLTCEFVDNDGIAFDLQLHDCEGNKVRKTLLVGERVALAV